MMNWRVPVLLAGGLAAAGLARAQVPEVRFQEQTIDPALGIGYAVTVADVDGDKKPDIIAVNEHQVCWYQNPTWTKHVIVNDATPRDNVCIAATDLDGDGKAELALGAFWKPSDTVGSGSVHYLLRQGDPREPWKVTDLESEPTVHRMRWADVDGDGKPELVMVPLQGRGTKGPDWTGSGVRISVYHISADGKGPVTREIADDTLHVAHNLWPVRWERGSRGQQLLVASFEGIHLLKRGADGKWEKTKLVDGDQVSRPNRGCSEVKLGRLPNGRRFLATIEPWHGNQAVVYTQNASGAWERHMLDDTLREGHGLWCADVDGRPGDEILVGWRNPDSVNNKVGVAVFSLPGQDIGMWEKRLVDDNGMACEDLTAADLDGDGKPDVVASGRATHNLKIYWNRR